MSGAFTHILLGDMRSYGRLLVLPVVGERLSDDLLQLERRPAVPPFQARECIEDSISTRPHPDNLRAYLGAATAQRHRHRGARLRHLGGAR